MHAGAQAIAAGAVHNMVLKADGTVLTTGGNYYGQIGDGTNIDRKTFMKVSSGQ